ncbi:MAG: lipopolysaccharide core heptose(I) kinase RfaP [Desulfosarcina sp.]|nr:lipopolysaccharide core heptose(I) kinase RfaP [Desulfobacterales bacterium]
MLMLSDDLPPTWRSGDIYALLADLEGQVYRDRDGRRTFRFELDGRGYFAKVFQGLGWKKLGACLLKCRKPVLSAENEWRVIRCLHRLGVPTMRIMGYGRRGWNPARRQSFIITEELAPTISLEAYCRDWKKTPPPPGLKRALIRRVAGIARRLHENGINHRDFYICHFLLDLDRSVSPSGDSTPRLFLIDLHRAEQSAHLKTRWRIKDIAGLYFSSLDIGLTTRDHLRFVQTYCNRPWRDALLTRKRFWQRVVRRGQAGYREFERKNPDFFR